MVKSKLVWHSQTLSVALTSSSRLFQVWQKHLGTSPFHVCSSRTRSQHGRAILRNLLSACAKSTSQVLQTQADHFIHTACSISLGASLKKITPSIILATLEAATLALSCESLQSFVYVSTAYANAHIHNLCNGTDYGTISEQIHTFSNGCLSLNSAASELESILSTGMPPDPTTLEHFPYAYAYAKHLTERLLTNLFTTTSHTPSLLIVRPSIIGPALSSPFSHYSVAVSTPITCVAAALTTRLPLKPFIFASPYDDPSESWSDEIPVDVVVNRLLLYLSAGTTGIVHAVCGSPLARQRANNALVIAAVNRERVLPWPVKLATVPSNGSWTVPGVSKVSRLFISSERNLISAI
jgi:fatty acyl-CoA reductase